MVNTENASEFPFGWQWRLAAGRRDWGLLVTGFALAEALPRQRPDEAVRLHPRRAGILHDPVVDLPQCLGEVIAPDPDQVGLSVVLRIVNGFGDGDGVPERVRDAVYGIVVQRPMKFAGPQSVHCHIAVFVLVVWLPHVADGPPVRARK